MYPLGSFILDYFEKFCSWYHSNRSGPVAGPPPGGPGRRAARRALAAAGALGTAGSDNTGAANALGALCLAPSVCPGTMRPVDMITRKLNIMSTVSIRELNPMDRDYGFNRSRDAQSDGLIDPLDHSKAL